MRWLAIGLVFAVVVLGIVRLAGPALLEPASDTQRWVLSGLVALALAAAAGVALARAPVAERGWAALAMITPGLIVHAIAADLFATVFPMLRAASDRAWSALVLLVFGVVAAIGLVMGRR